MPLSLVTNRQKGAFGSIAPSFDLAGIRGGSVDSRQVVQDYSITAIPSHSIWLELLEKRNTVRMVLRILTLSSRRTPMRLMESPPRQPQRPSVFYLLAGKMGL